MFESFLGLLNSLLSAFGINLRTPGDAPSAYENTNHDDAPNGPAPRGDYDLPLHVNSEFGEARSNRLGYHDGVDIKARVGDDVTAIRPGHIVSISEGGNAGLHVTMVDDMGCKSVYCHLSGIASGLREGQSVAPGQVLGEVGMTGHTTGPHLHYAVVDPRGNHIDPMAYISQHALALPVHNAAYGAEAKLHARNEAMTMVADANRYDQVQGGLTTRMPQATIKEVG